jgi:hypothetical protein
MTADGTQKDCSGKREDTKIAAMKSRFKKTLFWGDSSLRSE